MNETESMDFHLNDSIAYYHNNILSTAHFFHSCLKLEFGGI